MTAPLPENLPSPPPETPQYRPALHFTPAAHWMNDPNGLVFHQGVYHLFFQYYPEGLSWGPMHWGHASSTDLLRWEEHPIALYPDPLGLIFSGSVVWDERNLSGLAPAGSAPLVAIFTHHDSAAARAGAISWETQSLAWSVDNGLTWTKYAGNPVLKNPGLRDFRDPKVFWLAETGRWVMSLSTGTQIAFYSSADLKDWQLTSKFGADAGSHGGTWECPDLFSLPLNGRQRWVLLVSLTSGGPNGGSATQYFIGDFDGQRFTPEHHDVRWLDLGCDNYAGVTWSGTGERRVFIGWMGNWDYAKVVPTAPWRSAMTLPRELSLREVSGQTRLAARPAG
ncbi:glycoside hydrolase family 32 protein, partial [Ideonella sp.]|uniref:glycoside hydrolase family 32 protein n=1 Tax=Ideonella sp. TaxID=1929293 RepID=UPI003BB49085